MTSPPLPIAAWTDSLPESVRGFLEGPIGIPVLVVLAALIVFVLARFLGSLFRKAPKGPEHRLREDLSSYPPPPGKPGPRRLTIEGVPGRLRLIVIAPVGKGRPIDEEHAEDVANGVIRGLKEIIQRDKPRIRIWPPQLSNTGFAPTFHRLTEVPAGKGEESQWILIAGPASSAGKPILLGLAVLADEPCEVGKVVMTADRWSETVRIQTPNA